MTFDEWQKDNWMHIDVKENARTIWDAAQAEERAACISACEAAEDTGNATGIERDVATWNKAVAYCVRRIKELQ
ncbi:MAG: hypothetical protein WC236_14680 [Gallionellaceae bacterium]|jgi:hypothetical protein